MLFWVLKNLKRIFNIDGLDEALIISLKALTIKNTFIWGNVQCMWTRQLDLKKLPKKLSNYKEYAGNILRIKSSVIFETYREIHGDYVVSHLIFWNVSCDIKHGNMLPGTHLAVVENLNKNYFAFCRLTLWWILCLRCVLKITQILNK